MTGGDFDEPAVEGPTGTGASATGSRITYIPNGNGSSTTASSLPTPPPPTTAAVSSGVAPGSAFAMAGADEEFDPDEPRLPPEAEEQSAPEPIAPMGVSARTPRVTAASAYRSTQDRNRSVYRRANPWYRRLARGIIALSLISLVGVGVYVAARAAQDYLNRDQLPEASPDIPAIRESSFLLTATTPTIQLQGTLITDFETRSFEFVGLPDSPNANDRITRPEADVVYARNPDATWRVVEAGDPAAALVATIDETIDVLAGSGTSDVILTSQIRRDYVDLVAEIEEGEDDNIRTRYDLALDLESFASRFPVQWQNYQQESIPGVADSRRLDVSIWTDDESVLTRVQDRATGWNWERLDYSSGDFTAFQPPATQIVDLDTNETATGIECQLDDLAFTTTLSTCDEATAVGRQLAASVGLADAADSPAAGLAFASMCGVLQGDEPTTYEEDAYLELAGLLVDTGVCPGDTALLQPAG